MPICVSVESKHSVAIKLKAIAAATAANAHHRYRAIPAPPWYAVVVVVVVRRTDVREEETEVFAEDFVVEVVDSGLVMELLGFPSVINLPFGCNDAQ